MISKTKVEEYTELPSNTKTARKNKLSNIMSLRRQSLGILSRQSNII